MKIILTENQYNRLVEEDHWNNEKLYFRDKIVEKLKKGPKYMHQYIKKLPHIPMQDERGNVVIATKIPQTVYQFLNGNF
jgi:hypothetical protein